MRLFFPPIVSVALTFGLMSAAQAQQTEPKKPKPRPQVQTQTQPLKPLRAQPTGCTEFGAGFVRMPGSDSCVRVGGGVGVGVGIAR